MRKNIFEEYKKAVTAKYDKVKTGKYAAFLDRPSPANLKNYCLILFDEGLSIQDENTFRLFFKAKESDNLRTAIEHFGTGKLKSIQSFVNGTNTEDRSRIELVATMVDFTPRPFPKFIKEFDSANEVLDEENEDGKWTGADKPKGFTAEPSKSNNLNWKIAVLAILFLFFAGYTAKDLLLPKKECMQWQNDHYEPMDCNVSTLGSVSDIEPFDPKKADLKKLKITRNTVFFRNGIPLVWYIKRGDSCEFYTGPGLHPVTAKQLRPVSTLIVNKYVFGIAE